MEAVLKEVEDGKIKTKEGKMVDVQVKYVNEAMDAAGLQEFLKKCHRNTINQSKRKKGEYTKTIPKLALYLAFMMYFDYMKRLSYVTSS